MMVVGEKCPTCGHMHHDVINDGFVRETKTLWYDLRCTSCNHSWVIERRKKE